ncbi:hypothetical protein C8R46DRAFT_1355670 [Mycena filopes]|nr:hypothetical protein C8R46DRAFT_1355670 [Mycena filopes]
MYVDGAPDAHNSTLPAYAPSPATAVFHDLNDAQVLAPSHLRVLHTPDHTIGGHRPLHLTTPSHIPLHPPATRAPSRARARHLTRSPPCPSCGPCAARTLAELSAPSTRAAQSPLPP